MARTRKAPRSERYAFTVVGLGTWIDGAFGVDHAVQKMASDLLPTVVRRSSDAALQDAAQELMDEYDNDLEEDDWDEWLDDATEVVQDATEPGLTWEWDGGDLVLTQDVDVEK